ncbi:MHYT domain-containing protein [Rubrobacter marinus]|nr:MHYT domain-containing protein [Rubrobacter marinus]
MNEAEMAVMSGGVVNTAWSPVLVVLSYLIASLAAYTALDLAGRVVNSIGVARKVWLFGGAAAMGLGIWSMHFVGMMALSLNVNGEQVGMGYNLPVTVLSVLIAMGASAVALYTVSRESMGIKQLAIAGPIMGIAIAGMHYTGMAAMRMAVEINWNYAVVGLSVLIAIAASVVALFLAFRFGRTEGNLKFVLMGVAALVMGVAIVGMHYTGMAAASYAALDLARVMEGSHASHGSLGYGVGFATLLVLGFALVASTLDRRYAAQARALNARLAAQQRAQQVASQEG